MKIVVVEGQPSELAEYERLVGLVGQRAESVVIGGDDSPPLASADSTLELAGDLDPEDDAWLKQFIWSRGRDAVKTQLAEDYARAALDLSDLAVEPGRSVRTPTGESNYLMFRDAGPRKFGAVAYLLPYSAKLDFRLRPEDVDDLKERVIVRNIVKGQHEYHISLYLTTPDDVKLAIELTERALSKVRN
jgi:hypothetical protein